MENIKSHIERAIGILGSQSKLADAMGCSQQQISYLLRAKAISAEMAIAIDRATGGEVAREVLRPDIFHHSAPDGNTSPQVQGVGQR